MPTFDDLESLTYRVLFDYLAGEPTTGSGATWTETPVAFANHTPRGIVTSQEFDPGLSADVAPFDPDLVRRSIGYITLELVPLSDGVVAAGNAHDGITGISTRRSIALLELLVGIALPIDQREVQARGLAGELRELFVGWSSGTTSSTFHLRQRGDAGGFRFREGPTSNDSKTWRFWSMDIGLEREALETFVGETIVAIQPYT